MKNLTNASRRQMLLSTGGIAAMAGLAGVARADLGIPDPGAGGSAAKPFPAYASWKDADSMIVHSANTIETRRTAFGSSVITPTNRLFVRKNVAPPTDANMMKEPDSWTLEVSGVAKPRSFTVAELKTLGLAVVPMVLQCSGNGRAWFPHKPSGTQWTVGAAGCVVFTGVPVTALLEAVGGMSEGMVYMTSTGGEPIPQGLDPNTIRVDRSVPISAHQDPILEWEHNHEALPLAHGGPVRFLVPGYNGVNATKFLQQLAFTKEQSPAKIQQTSYRWTA